jgi:hypothetical protein
MQAITLPVKWGILKKLKERSFFSHTFARCLFPFAELVVPPGFL